MENSTTGQRRTEALIAALALLFALCSGCGLYAGAQEPLDALGRPRTEYQAEGTADPFEEQTDQKIIAPAESQVPGQPPEAVTTLPAMTVQGMVWGSAAPQAIINNTIVKEGDAIEGASIVKIDKEGVTLLYEGKKVLLSSPAAAGLESMQKQKSEGGKND